MGKLDDQRALGRPGIFERATTFVSRETNRVRSGNKQPQHVEGKGKTPDFEVTEGDGYTTKRANRPVFVEDLGDSAPLLTIRDVLRRWNGRS